MKRLYHLCLSSGREVMFRSREDIRVFTNAMALALFKTGTDLLVDAVMSNHVHMSVMTENLSAFVKSLRLRYVMYFNSKYHRSGKLGEERAFFLELKGAKHILTAWSYILRNPLHHGICSTPLGYEDSTVRYIFSNDLKMNKNRKIITSRDEIRTFLPSRAEFPDNYFMTEDGMFARDSFTQTRQVELGYFNVRTFLYFMNGPSSEEWRKSQEQDNNEREPITLGMIEGVTAKEVLQRMYNNERGSATNERMTDLDVCTLIDNEYVRGRYGEVSVYTLSDDRKFEIATELNNDYHLPKDKIRRCLFL